MEKVTLSEKTNEAHRCTQDLIVLGGPAATLEMVGSYLKTDLSKPCQCADEFARERIGSLGPIDIMWCDRLPTLEAHGEVDWSVAVAFTAPASWGDIQLQLVIGLCKHLAASCADRGHYVALFSSGDVAFEI